MGEEPPAFDLLTWNADSTRMPAEMHSFYLRSCYVENQLARGVMEMAGERLILQTVDQDLYFLARRAGSHRAMEELLHGCPAAGRRTSASCCRTPAISPESSIPRIRSPFIVCWKVKSSCPRIRPRGWPPRLSIP